jgi:hypothetical protein
MLVLGPEFMIPAPKKTKNKNAQKFPHSFIHILPLSLVELGFELRALLLQSRCPTT